ncbi:YchJ family protein [Dechloromonas hankyongensis]
MRSRYCAYVLKLENYLLATWHPDTRPSELDLAADGSKWLGLEVKKHLQSDDTHATVEFVARYRIAGKGHRLHETSRFVREDGRWYYRDGDWS